MRDLRPTQGSVGMRAVAAKQQRIEVRKADPERLAAFLNRRVIPAVRGPAQQLYIVDHHHLSLALIRSGIERAFVTVLKDLSGCSGSTFWDHMAHEGFAYPYDEKGEPIPARALPSTMRALRADGYRDLAWSVREAGGYEKSWIKYSEFKWANFFRTSIDPRLVKNDYDLALKLALRLARSSNASGLPGYRAEKAAA